MILEVYKKLEDIVIEKFDDIVISAKIVHSPAGRARKLRINIFDGSFVDVWISKAREYSYHWERRMVGGQLFRHDNAPQKKWKFVKTFPKHLHGGSDEKVSESHISGNPNKAIVEFMRFVREKLRK